MTRYLQRPFKSNPEAGVSTLWLSVTASGLLLAFIAGSNQQTTQAIQFGSLGDLRSELDSANRSALELASTLLATNQIQIEDAAGGSFSFKESPSLTLAPDSYRVDAGKLVVSTCNSRLEGRSNPGDLINGVKIGKICAANFDSVLRVTDVREINEVDKGQTRRVRFAMVEALSNMKVQKGDREKTIRSKITARLARPANGNAKCRFAQNPFYNELQELPSSLPSSIAGKLGWVGVYSFTQGAGEKAYWDGGYQSFENKSANKLSDFATIISKGPYTPFDKYYDGDPNTLQFKLQIDGRKIYSEITNIGDDSCNFVMYAPRGNSFNGGCFIPETKIKMADGKLRQIDAIKEGDRILDPVTGKGRLVTKLTRGLETNPLVVIKAQSQKLVVTEKHPIFTSRGLLAAADLKPTDRVRFPGKEWVPLTGLERRPPGPEQWVYNLELAGDADNPEAHTVIAEGMVVGDHHLQKELEQSEVDVFASTGK